MLLLVLQACLVGRSLYVFGGEDVQRRPLGDVGVLDLDTMNWQVRRRGVRGQGERREGGGYGGVLSILLVPMVVAEAVLHEGGGQRLVLPKPGIRTVVVC
jgi:hypothetical protein